ncbi:PadR family transcriptional regulator [bacterium (Candidatus Blackallbacteria) CG17_big_fil_post_rev_8_21_14_2_50_48_46]|uniref:PadR family transcriptional regulator n=1 Tax=bacterium (Candidatus Blackallbacteria) CG17_big_fil_post_rev_8_21_14_2_50_48_46 TaxID=2014261 RepID=A0A2M7G611_9BACT|nr:MAG: PadR family transcriptional regulator [bacterium (Candidatus Blackallbacteria) CG18_big_fil_WC_8_21_14_2_50_49_26]PIW17487.1 MAG: PadR family transcriptional regulator [bacterium (Candidatus Blackallbacteria) CG17_big_fil_post_rev_8_21_14_2_50_48_46]PIW48341.1 MAG: PadR family transcriptional regulator [bacterium (Candidatus Blackallbacteria) CG13_big_fil_rev_8_21_14_2_50_49_14]
MHQEFIKNWQSQLLKGSLELCILSLIGERTRYAFEMIQELNDFEGLSISEGSIYPLLKRLQKEGLIDTFWSESSTGPPRKYYRLTEKGHEILTRMRLEWLKFSDFLNHLMQRTETSHEIGHTPSPDHPLPLTVRKRTEDLAP